MSERTADGGRRTACKKERVVAECQAELSRRARSSLQWTLTKATSATKLTKATIIGAAPMTTDGGTEGRRDEEDILLFGIRMGEATAARRGAPSLSLDIGRRARRPL